MRRNDRLAVWFALVVGAVSAAVSAAAGHPPERIILSGVVGLAVGGALMIALRWRP